MSFDLPVALAGLALIPLAIIAYVFAQQRRPKYAARFTNVALLAAVVKERPNWRRHLPPILLLTALAALIVAFARPHMTFAVPKNEATVMLVTDTSGSMMAEDISPNRLEVARDAAKQFADGLPDSVKLGLASFSNTAGLNIAPTTDRDQVKAALDSQRPQGGTAMGDGLSIGVEQVREVAELAKERGEGDETPAAIVLLSDGENTSGTAQPLDVANQAKELGVPVYTIALGTPEGTITLQQPGDVVPRTIPVPPDTETLQQIAETTGGRTFDAESPDQLKEIYEDLGARVGTEQEEREVTAAFAGGAVVLLLLGGGLSLRWFGRLV